jgi:hypothetical protein
MNEEGPGAVRVLIYVPQGSLLISCQKQGLAAASLAAENVVVKADRCVWWRAGYEWPTMVRCRKPAMQRTAGNVYEASERIFCGGPGG